MPKIKLRGVRVVLGLLWLLDGALQLQHQMFTSAFVSQVVSPATAGQPRIVSGPMNFGAHIFLLHPAIFNALFAVTQMAIGVLILWKRSLKIGLIFSVFWGLIVWVFGEGYGGILSGHTLMLMGAPGAVIIYVLLALAVMPKKPTTKSKSPNKQQIAYWVVFVWVIIWIGGGIYQLLPGQNSTSDVSAMITGNADGAPGWLASVDTSTANFIQRIGKSSTKLEPASQIASGMNMTGTQMQHMTNEPYVSTTTNPGYSYILIVAIIQILVGLGALISGIYRKLAVSLGIVLALFFWVVGQSLGAYFTGLATDPNSGPLLILLGLSILGCTNLDQKLSQLYRHLTKLLVSD